MKQSQRCFNLFAIFDSCLLSHLEEIKNGENLVDCMLDDTGGRRSNWFEGFNIFISLVSKLSCEIDLLIECHHGHQVENI